MDRLKFVLLIQNGIKIPEDLRIFLRDYLVEYAQSDDWIIETNSIAVLAYTEELRGNPAKVRLIDNFTAALHYYFGYEKGCKLMVLSESPMEETIYSDCGLRPRLAGFPYTEPITEFLPFDKKNSKVSLKVYETDAHENPNLRYFR